MSDPIESSLLNRRALLLGAVALVGGGAALTRFLVASKGGSGRRLSSEQFSVLEQVTDAIIPATDTPGALAAGVPAFVDDMLNEWGSRETFAGIVRVLEAYDQLAWRRFGATFLELPGQRRLEVVRRIDSEFIGAADPAYRKFKTLVLTGYYHSEIGATQELRYELVPGAWRPCLPLSEIGRASAV